MVFVTFSHIRENIYPLHHNNHGNHQKQQRRCQTLLPGVHVYQACYSEDTTVVEVCEAVQYWMQGFHQYITAE
jgi:hypothetical protein